MGTVSARVIFRTACSSATLAAAIMAIPANAQSAGASAQGVAPAADEQAVNEIVVSGYRESLESAIRDKRNADQIVDGISAEDIGQFPDENVAESLQRVTGIQIDRSQNAYGEGSFVSIRGLGPDATRTFVNGRAVLSSKFADRSVDFRDLPADFVQNLQVIKSPNASNIEGSLGGIVNVVTRRPLDNGGGFKASMSAQGTYADLDKKWLPSVVGLVSDSWADNTIGVTLSASYAKRDNRQDGFVSNGYDCRSPTALATSAPCAGATTVYLPRAARFQIDYVPSERIGVGGTVQWRPSDRFELSIDGLWNRREEALDQISLVALTNAGGIAAGSVATGDDRSVLAYTQGTTTFRVIDQQNTNLATVFNGGANARYTGDGFKLEADVAYSRSNARGKFNQAVIDNRSLGGFTFDVRTPSRVPDLNFGGLNANPLSGTGFYPFQVRQSTAENRQEDKQYRASATIDLGGGEAAFSNSVEIGLRYSDASYFAGVFGARARSNFLTLPAAQQVPFVNPGQFVTTLDGLLGVNDFGRQLPGLQVGNFVIPNVDALNAAYLPANFALLPNVLDTALIGEKALSGYGQFNFSFGRVGGNIGVRYVRTRVSSSGEVIAGQTPPVDLFSGQGVTIRPVTVRKEYEDWLPSANIRFSIVPDRLILRLAASRSMFRPEPDDLASRGTLNTNTLQLVTGNPALDPFRSWNLDASMEYYFGRDGLLSLALFYKDIQSFILPGVPTGETVVVDGISYTVVGPVNGNGGKLQGLEAGLQTSLKDIAPSPLDGLGLVVNYTYIDDKTSARLNASTGQFAGLPDVSKHSFNVIGYYENGGLSARLAYNWRSSFLQADRTSGQLNTFTDAYGSLDGRIAYKVLPSVELSIEGKNLTNAPVRGYAESRERISEYYNFGRRFFLGVRASF